MIAEGESEFVMVGRLHFHKAQQKQLYGFTGSVFGHFFCLFLMLFLPAVAVAQEWDPLVDRLAADGFSKEWLVTLFNRPQMQFNPSVMAVKMKTLYKNKFGDSSVRELQRRLAILGYKPGRADGKTGAKTRKAIRWFQAAHGLTVDGRFSEQLLVMALKERNRAPTNVKIPPTKPGPLVYQSIMTEERLMEAKAFLAANQKILLRLERHYGVPSEIAVGILTVETRLGTYLGEESAFQTLASMALCDHFNCVADAFKDEHLTKTKRRWIKRRTAQKARWAYGECKALLTYALQSGRDPLTIPGSLYGAIGIAQFMPSQALRHGADGNGDGVVDLFVLDDALFSMGNYLMSNGWRGSMRSRRKQRRAIYNYNHSTIYVNTVLAVADYLEEGRTVFMWDETGK
ncbi:MAG: lytic murein transglycosylase [Deltaproteobacteria bacterium]|nr:lytic murein transglycosylase [Deltaproteobacteria bacterium]